MESAIFSKPQLNYEGERDDFRSLFDFVDSVMGDGAFVRYRKRTPIGGLAPAYFEAITLGLWRVLKALAQTDHTDIRNALIDTVQSDEFRSFVGSGSNSIQKFNGRINTIETSMRNLINDTVGTAD